MTSWRKLGELHGHIFSRLLARSSPKHAQRFTARYHNIGLTTLLSTTARCGTQHQTQCHHAKRATTVAEIPSILRRLQVRNSSLTLHQKVRHLTLSITGLLGSTSATTRKEAIESKADLFSSCPCLLFRTLAVPSPPTSIQTSGSVQHAPAGSGGAPVVLRHAPAALRCAPAAFRPAPVAPRCIPEALRLPSGLPRSPRQPPGILGGSSGAPRLPSDSPRCSLVPSIVTNPFLLPLASFGFEALVTFPLLQIGAFSFELLVLILAWPPPLPSVRPRSSPRSAPSSVRNLSSPFRPLFKALI